MGIITLTPENIDREHICCALADKKNADGVQAKKAGKTYILNPDTPGGNPHAASSCRSPTKPRLKLGRKMEFDVGKFFHCQGQRIGSIGQEYLASALV